MKNKNIMTTVARIFAISVVAAFVLTWAAVGEGDMLTAKKYNKIMM
jgi:hypothetical protein